MIYKRGDKWHMDVVINGVRYREALGTTDRREAKDAEKRRIAEIQAGKNASKAGRSFAKLTFDKAADQFIEDRKLHVAERTHQLDRERLRPLREYFGEKTVRSITAADIAAYQKARIEGGLSLSGNKKQAAKPVAPRTVNMEITVLRQLLRKAKTWNTLAEDVQMLKESGRTIGRALPAEAKHLLFQTAATRSAWLVAHCAAVLAVNTTCRGVELKNLQWQDVDLFDRVLRIRRSKTDTGLRTIPLNADAMTALARLRERSEKESASNPEHFVFPACENGNVDPSKPQRTWRTAWRSLVKETAKRAGDAAVKLAEENGGNTVEARRKAELPYAGMRFHDLRHQAISELAEAGASDAVIMSLAGHMSREMMEHYSHVRMAAKRSVIDALSSGPVPAKLTETQPAQSTIQ